MPIHFECGQALSGPLLGDRDPGDSMKGNNATGKINEQPFTEAYSAADLLGSGTARAKADHTAGGLFTGWHSPAASSSFSPMPLPKGARGDRRWVFHEQRGKAWTSVSTASHHKTRPSPSVVDAPGR